MDDSLRSNLVLRNFFFINIGKSMDKYPYTVTQTKKIQKNLKDFVKFGESDTIFF